MKPYVIMMATAVALMTAACVENPVIEFGVDTGEISIGPQGGKKSLKVSSSGEWVAMTESPWITVSPANGRGSVECTVSIDSTLMYEQRTGTVRIQSLDTDEKKDFTITQ